jgi:serine/threonine-protein kinase HipA
MSPARTTELEVFLHDEPVGRLERLPQARLRFSYRPEWVEAGGGPLSLSLPPRFEPYEDAECGPFFEGLLPEGDFLRAVARAFAVSADRPSRRTDRQ